MTFAQLVQSLVERLRPNELEFLGFIWGTTLIGAAIAFLAQDYHGEARTLRGFVRFCIPLRVVTARQTRLDFTYAVTMKLARLLWQPALLGNTVAAWLSYRAIGAVTRVPAPASVHSPSLAVALVVVAVGVLAADFGNFFGHYLCHRFRFLWEFHKVHHSALSLTPMTEHRFHPFDEVWNVGWTAAGNGVWIALAAYCFALPLADTTILGIDAYYLVNCFSFFHLRHSHIYLRYPAWLERILLSPAQHQIHHSREKRHWDRNIGLLFACWDRMFGTFVASEPAPATNLGLDAGQEHYLHVGQLFVMPFAATLRRLISAVRPGDGNGLALER